MARRKPRDIRPLGTVYEQTRSRVVELVTASGDPEGAAATPVEACPGWSVHDVLAHLAGACADIVVGNVEGAATDHWTAAQVTARQNSTVADLFAEWGEVAPTYASWIDDFPGRYCQQAVADIT